MEEFWILILVAFYAINSLDKAESVKVKSEETPLKTFDEIFGEGWWDKGEAEDLKTPAPTNFGQNVHYQIDRQNTKIGQIEPNSTDQLGQIELNSTDQNPPHTKSDQLGQIELNSTDQNPPHTKSDHSGQIEPNSTDQNPPHTKSDHSGQIEPNSPDQNPHLTESDHSGQIEPNSTDQNPSLTAPDHYDNAKNGEEITSNEKRNIVAKFHAMKNEFKQIGKYSTKEWIQIEKEIAEHLHVNRTKIYKWKKEFGIRRKVFNEKEERTNLVEKFDQKKAELKRAGFKDSYHNEINEIVAKELGLSFTTIYKWKRKLGQPAPKHMHSHSEQMELMKRYYEIKDKNPKISDKEIAKRLSSSRHTLYRWKKQFKRQQFHQNSVDGHSVEVNAAANVQEIVCPGSSSLNEWAMIL